MPVPQPLIDLAGNQAFWDQFFWVGKHSSQEHLQLVNHKEPWDEKMWQLAHSRGFADSEELVHRYCQLNFLVGEHGLRLEFPPDLSDFNLSLLRPGNPPVEIAWDDQAHWHPHVLRWEELDLVCRVQALTDSTLIHPGLPVLLLQRFAPLTTPEDGDAAMSLLRSVVRSVGLSDDAATRYVRTDGRGHGVEWRYTERFGWWLHQDIDNYRREVHVYTLRHPENTDFPSTDFDRMIDHARHVCRSAVRAEWRTSAVMGLAEAVAADGTLDRLPILADALEEAGCGQPAILTHLRDPYPARGAWVVELLLGTAWGSVLRLCR
jgi:hypothetical protein